MNIEQFLTVKDLEEIIYSLQKRKESFENSEDYPSHEFKKERVESAQILIQKVRDLKDVTVKK